MRSSTAFLAITIWLSSLCLGDFFVQTTLTRRVGPERTGHPSSVSKWRQPPPSYRRDQSLPVSSWFEQLWTKPAAPKETKPSEVDALKQQLLDSLQPTQRGVSTTRGQQDEIYRLMAALEPFNPNPGLASNDSLSGLWVLQWTTEKEILFLMEKGLFDLPSGLVQQSINVDAKALSNTMLFGPDSFLNVSSSISPEDDGRVNFEFNACQLKYRALSVPLPPVGKGWFQSVYLDDDLRVTRDVRGDVSVLIKARD